MKKLFLLITAFLFLFNCGAQVLDTISLKEFKGLTHKTLKKVFSNNQEAIDLIQKNRHRKLLAYSLYAATVPLVFTKNPLLILPLSLGFSLHGNNSKQNLYSKLLSLEKIKLHPDSAQEYLPNTKNTYRYKFNHFVFDMSFEEFNALSKNQLNELLLINDTIQYIIDYCKSKNEPNQSELWPSTVFIGGGGLVLALGAFVFMNKESDPNIPMIIFSGGGGLSCLLGIFLLPPKQKFKLQNIQMQTYYGLRQYFTTHEIPTDLAKFISIKK